jgi:pimeloyl-ACP methyl ester carboxylesterase
VEGGAVPRLAINGAQLFYEETGDGGRALVVVHGFTGSRDDFRGHLPALASLGRTIAYDQRGHGQSAATGDPEACSFAQLAADLGALLAELCDAPCDLLGHSMGGMIALRAALEHPERIASLILMDTAARAPDEMPRAPMAAAATIAREQGMATVADIMKARALVDAGRTPAERRVEAKLGESYWQRRRTNLMAMDSAAFARLVLEIVDQAPLTSRLAEIRCPTTVLVGTEDVSFARPAAELAAGVPGATLVTIPDAAHSPQLENPSAWREALWDHLQRVRQA